MEKHIQDISKYSDKKINQYFDNEELNVLHSIKLFADDMYYNEGKDIGLTDFQYDVLKDTIKRRDPEYKVPVGAKIREGENRVKLPFWLGSMDKFKPEDDNEINRWKEENKCTEYIIEDKLDGISCLVIITKGKIKIYTRGDGVIGADISYLAQYLEGIPSKKNVNVRGELIIPVEVFNKKYSNDYANPRNMVAGCIGAKTIRSGLSDIKFIAYEIVGEGHMKKPSEQLEYLSSIGFTTVRNEIFSSFTTEMLMETLVRFKKDNIFEIDGIIVQPNKVYERNTDGNPNYAFAFKMLFSDNLIESEVVSVDWNVSKWGQLKPRVEILPVKLGGVTITFATGFNGKYIYENNIGEGAIVKITRSGDVIPYIVEIIKEAKSPDMPDIPWKWNDTHVDIIVEESNEIMCIKLISSFFADLGIKHLGEKTVEKMYNSGMNSLLKIISASKESISKVEGFGDKGAERVYDNIRKGMKDLYIPIVLGSSGIFGFGIGKRKITKLFQEIPNILEEYKTMSNEELYDLIMSVDGFSEKTTESIIQNIEWADKFIVELSNFATFKKKVVTKNNMNGLKVVFSGFRDASLLDKVTERGGQVVGSISKNTNILVVSGKLTGKTKKAQELGIKIMEKEEFMNKYISNK
jgi:NAD-dependent DNA ligase